MKPTNIIKLRILILYSVILVLWLWCMSFADLLCILKKHFISLLLAVIYFFCIFARKINGCLQKNYPVI